MSEVQAVYEVDRVPLPPADGEFLYSRVNSRGGVSWFESLAELLAHDAGCRDEESVAAVEHLQRIGRAVMVLIEAQTAVKAFDGRLLCSGRAETRDAGYRIYATHSSGVCCPWHGEPKSRTGRVTKYVSVNAKKDKVAEFEQAMVDWAAFEAAVAHEQTCKLNLEELSRKMVRISWGW